MTLLWPTHWRTGASAGWRGFSDLSLLLALAAGWFFSEDGSGVLSGGVDKSQTRISPRLLPAARCFAPTKLTAETQSASHGSE